MISGRVQGVFFRAEGARRARDRGLAGWVRNLPDDTVEAAFEGLDAEVDAMVDWCRSGPDLALVESVGIRPEPLSGERDFRVTR